MSLDDVFREKGVDNIYISEVTVFELRFGAENSENVRKSHEAVDRFIKRISIIPIIGSVNVYAETKVKLRMKGKPINDEFDYRRYSFG